MNNENLNQYDSYYTKNACTIVSLLNILKYRYAILVEPTFLVKAAIFFDKLGVFSIGAGATFNVIGNSFVYYLNLKLGLNFSLIVNQITKLKEGDDDTYQLGIKGYSTYKFNKIKADGIITNEEMDYLSTFSGGIGHATNWDGSAGGYFTDTDGSKNIKMSLDTLKYGESKGLFWDTIRTISPADVETLAVCNITVQLYIEEKKGTLEEYLLLNDNKYVTKAKNLYFYGRNK